MKALSNLIFLASITPALASGSESDAKLSLSLTSVPAVSDTLTIQVPSEDNTAACKAIATQISSDTLTPDIRTLIIEFTKNGGARSTPVDHLYDSAQEVIAKVITNVPRAKRELETIVFKPSKKFHMSLELKSFIFVNHITLRWDE